MNCSIPIQMIKRPIAMGQLASLRQHTDAIQAARDQLHMAALGNLPEIVSKSLNEYAATNCGFAGRTYDLWSPPLAVATWADSGHHGPTYETLMHVAKHVMNNYSEERLPELDTLILRTLRSQVQRNKTPTPGAILELARGQNADLCRSLTPRGLSEVLKRYGIHTQQGAGERKYRTADAAFTELENRFGAELPPNEPLSKLTEHQY